MTGRRRLAVSDGGRSVAAVTLERVDVLGAAVSVFLASDGTRLVAATTRRRTRVPISGLPPVTHRHTHII